MERAERLEGEEHDEAKGAAKTAATVAASALLATSLVSALSEPPHAELMTLPEPVPLVQYYQADDDQLVDDEHQEEEEESRWQRLRRLLKYLLAALALLLALAFGVLKGCAGAVTGLLPPAEDERQEQTTTHRDSTEDERGVAVG